MASKDRKPTRTPVRRPARKRGAAKRGPATRGARESGAGILAIDVGGTNVKVLATGQSEPLKIPSGPTMTARQMVTAVKKATAGWSFDRISIGYPGVVSHGRILTDPKNLGPGWAGFDFVKAFRKPVRLINDAAMQALGSYSGGRMLFLGLGTGLGSAFVVDGIVEPMELAHLPYRKGHTYEDDLGIRGLERLGKKRWRKAVADVVERLAAALEADSVVLGGGNVKKLAELPARCVAGSNENAFTGGFRLWDERIGRSATRSRGSGRARSA